MAVPWIPSPRTVVDALLDLLNVGPEDVFVDLGCGDGRVVLEAAKRGAKAVCIEVDRVLCNIAEIWAQLMGVSDRFEVIRGDFFKIDLSAVDPTIVYAYLYPSTLEELSPKLEAELSAGTVVTTLDFAIRGWSPVYVKALVDEHGYDRILWIYVVGISNPRARVAGLAKNLEMFASRIKMRRFKL